MLKHVLNNALREKAGADSYNRFEYQVGWVVFHNQQGQDPENLKAIHQLIGQLQGKGQTIIASERPTGHEDGAHVIWLHDKRALLNAATFEAHEEIVNRLFSLAQD